MRVRDATLLYQETQSSDASTKTIDLDVVDPVSALGFEFQATNGTTRNQNNSLEKCITKIEIVDGADVLCALSGEEIQALQFYKTGKRPMMRVDEQASKAYFSGMMLLFGRYLYDQEYAIDFTRFKNPQLKITWDLTKVSGALNTTTTFATGTFKISVWAKILEGMPAPGRFLMGKEIDSWTGATGDKRKELPLDYVYHMIMLQTYLAGNDIRENITKVKMSCDTDKFIPFERYMFEWDEEMAQLFGNVIIWKRAFATNDDSVYLPINREPHVAFVKDGNAALRGYDVGLNYCWSGVANIYACTTDGSAYGTDFCFDILIEGHALHDTQPIPMGDMMRPETWFDPTSYRKVELVLTEAAAAANKIIVEQVRPN